MGLQLAMEYRGRKRKLSGIESHCGHRYLGKTAFRKRRSKLVDHIAPATRIQAIQMALNAAFRQIYAQRAKPLLLLFDQLDLLG